MSDSVQQHLARLLPYGPALLADRLIGLEKESLRVSPDGGIAQSAHPPGLGSALTHPYLTTDYSEALLEFITPPLHSVPEALAFLRDAHRFVYEVMDNEILWATSMPCVLSGEGDIPIARYGSSNAGTMKTVYRRGLGYRYGRTMQVIAGVHFNYSLPEAFWRAFVPEGDPRPLGELISAGYFAMIRNLQRFGWLVPYLFGASPAVCRSFLCGKPRPPTMEAFNANTYFEPFGTSLRMGDIGYQNTREGEAGIKANYDSLDKYVDSLTCAIDTPSAAWEKIGTLIDGEWRQLSTNILQIENEYYSTVRPKQPPQDNEKPTLALKRRGVAYVELRSLDVNAFHPLGISEQQLYFLEVLMLFCLLEDSPPLEESERREIDFNQSAAAHRGRDPHLELRQQGRARPLREWAAELCEAMAPVAAYLDAADPAGPYREALDAQCEAVADGDRTPSARMLAEMHAHGEGFFKYAQHKSLEHRDFFAAQPLGAARRRFFEERARESLAQQAALEAADGQPFAEYLAAYLAQR